MFKRSVSLLQASIILTNLANAKKDIKVGFEDADRTYEQVVECFSSGKAISLPQDVLESALWACNLLDEQQKFFHPSDHTFDSFVRRIINTDKERFNKELNFIEPIKV